MPPRKRHKTMAWALTQARNRALQGLSYVFDKGWANPSRIIFCVTMRCNIRCQQCAFWRMPKTPELSTEEWKDLMRQLHEWLGPCRVQLAGGETFVRQDIPDIVRHASDLGILTGVVSNGTLIDRALARRLVDSGLGYIHISVDGIKAQTHDEIRGIPGVFAKTMAAVDYLAEESRGSGMSICLATVISRRNMNELGDIVRLVEQKGLDGVIFNPLGPTMDSDPDWFRKTDLWFDDLSAIDRVLDELMAMRRHGACILNPPEHFEEMKKYFQNPSATMREGCRVGVTNLSITCDGFIHTCFKMPALGHVREIQLRDAWHSEKARDIRRQIKTCSLHCSPGNFVYRRSLLAELARFIRFG